MTTRGWLIGFALVVAAVGWLRSADPRAEAERILSDAIGRTVHIEALEVDPTNGRVRLDGVVVDNLEGWGPQPLMTAQSVRLDLELDELLDGHVDTAVRATGVVVRVQKRGEATNVEGLGRRPSGHRRSVDLDLDLILTDARVELADLDRNETLVLEQVELASTLSNRDGDASSSVGVHIASASLHGVSLHDVSMRVMADETAVSLHELSARIGTAGSLSGGGELRLQPSTWSFALTVDDVALDEEILPIVATVYPPLLSVTSSSTQSPRGELFGSVSLAGQGLHWDAVRPSLTGQGSLRLEGLEIPATSLVASVLTTAGREASTLTLDEASASFAVQDQWVSLQRVTVGRHSVRSPLQGRVSLDGELDLVVDLMPLLRTVGGGAHATVERVTTSLPLRVRGTTQTPDLQPPTARDVTAGLLGGALKRAAGQ